MEFIYWLPLLRCYLARSAFYSVSVAISALLYTNVSVSVCCVFFPSMPNICMFEAPLNLVTVFVCCSPHYCCFFGVVVVVVVVAAFLFHFSCTAAKI